jgi:membrane protease YdiL (CAAX protease family)
MTRMADFLTGALIFAAANADVGGRGDNPSEGTGIVTILVIVALVLAAGLALAYAFTRGRARRRSMERHPDRAGRVGRVSSMGQD